MVMHPSFKPTNDKVKYTTFAKENYAHTCFPPTRQSRYQTRTEKAAHHHVSNALKRLIITNPLERFLIKNFMLYFPEEGVLQITPQLWQDLRYYEVVDALKSADEQINY